MLLIVTVLKMDRGGFPTTTTSNTTPRSTARATAAGRGRTRIVARHHVCEGGGTHGGHGEGKAPPAHAQSAAQELWDACLVYRPHLRCQAVGRRQYEGITVQNTAMGGISSRSGSVIPSTSGWPSEDFLQAAGGGRGWSGGSGGGGGCCCCC